ncbi:hypothetical protein WBJ53_25315 [Spirosoma sp. SC4-14]|uniref:hypothetical protein n=1 Tax=Spirosoma sp. SC4-14 TaxID=3128900 RepID=UPI0030D53A83
MMLDHGKAMSLGTVQAAGKGGEQGSTTQSMSFVRKRICVGFGLFLLTNGLA